MRRLVMAWLLTGCALTACSPHLPGGGSGGLVVITAGGTALLDGADDVPPTLDLRVAGAALLSVRLDGAGVVVEQSGDGFSASVAPMALGSAHGLDIGLPGRSSHIAFRVVAPTGVMAAAHAAGGSPVVDVAFERAPDRVAVGRATAPASALWGDDQHLTLRWPATPPAFIELPATIGAARGSHLAGRLRLDVATASGALRRVTVPPAPAPGRATVVGFSVGSAASHASASAHVQDLSTVVPAGWRIGSDGELVGAPDPTALAAAATAQVPVWPLVQNDATDSSSISTLLNDSTASRQLVRRITDAVAHQGVPGIHLDLEGVPAADRDRLTRLVHDLAGSLHANRARLAVDVIPHRSGHLNQYSAAYDTTAIGRDADIVALLAYDQHTASSDAGPVAGLDWQAQVLAGTLPGLDPARTLLGVPLYARTWDGGSSQAAPYQDSVSSALNHQGATVDYDFAAATPLIRWQGSTGPSAAYFDDADSLARKFGLASSRGMAGVAAWRLGFEDPGFWALAQLSERG